MDRWLARLRHDLLKHAAFRARDLRALLDEGGGLRPGDVEGLRRTVQQLPDAEGRPVGLTGAWRGLRADFDDELPGETDALAAAALRSALDAFEAQVQATEAEVARPGGEGSEEARRLCAALGALEAAFDRLAHDVKRALGA